MSEYEKRNGKHATVRWVKEPRKICVVLSGALPPPVPPVDFFCIRVIMAESNGIPMLNGT